MNRPIIRLVGQQTQRLLDAVQSGESDRAADAARTLVRRARVLLSASLRADAAESLARSAAQRTKSARLLDQSRALRARGSPRVGDACEAADLRDDRAGRTDACELPS
jgi:hypothetical protein